jgi:C_GCAxxG_C_C family probable redox protein
MLGGSSEVTVDRLLSGPRPGRSSGAAAGASPTVSVEAFPTVSPTVLRRRSVGNLLRMGHCAPTVMQTMLDASDTEAAWLVKLTAGLPGGIGNTGGECGGLTAPLVLMGLRYGRAECEGGLPVVVEEGHDLLQRFRAACGTTRCVEIRGRARVPLRCVGVVRQAPGICAECLAARRTDAVSPAAREAYRELCGHWQRRGFHCADAVFAGLEGTVDAPPAVRDAVTAFMGGTLLTGMTCSALTAGVMALGLAVGQIEDSRPRVLRMIGTMAVGGNAFADELNAFNRVMNLGHRLARWFEAEFASIQCQALTRTDFAAGADVRSYVERDGTSACERIADRVAARVAEMLESLAAVHPA